MLPLTHASKYAIMHDVSQCDRLCDTVSHGGIPGVTGPRRSSPSVSRAGVGPLTVPGMAPGQGAQPGPPGNSTVEGYFLTARAWRVATLALLNQLAVCRFFFNPTRIAVGGDMSESKRQTERTKQS